MELGEIKESVNDWINKRLKNPYFAAVLLVWVISNRVALFLVFNFNETQSPEERLKLIKDAIDNREILFFSGFYGIIIYSLIVGFITMIIFNYLNVFGFFTYNYFGRIANEIRKKTAPLDWVSKDELEKSYKDLKKIEIENEKQRNDISILRSEKDKFSEDIDALKFANGDLETKLNEKNNIKQAELDKYQQQINELESYKKSLDNYQSNLYKSISDLKEKINNAKLAPNAHVWIYRNNSIVFDYIFMRQYHVTVDVNFAPNGWEVVLFGRKDIDFNFINKRLIWDKDFLRLNIHNSEKRGSSIIFSLVPFHEGIDNLYISLRNLINAIENCSLRTQPPIILDNSKLEIVVANYIWEENGIMQALNVSNAIHDLINKNIYSFIIDPSVFAINDPAPGILKKLNIYFSYKSNQYNIVREDGELFNFITEINIESV